MVKGLSPLCPLRRTSVSTKPQGGWGDGGCPRAWRLGWGVVGCGVVGLGLGSHGLCDIVHVGDDLCGFDLLMCCVLFCAVVCEAAVLPTPDTLSPDSTYQAIVDTGAKKATLSAMETFLRSIVAGVFIAIGGLLALSVGASCPGECLEMCCAVCGAKVDETESFGE